MVRVRGLEPPRIAALEPKSSVSTNSTMLALWCRNQESNPGPIDYKSIALPTELLRRYRLTLQFGQKSLLSSSALHSLHVFIQYLCRSFFLH